MSTLPSRLPDWYLVPVVPGEGLSASDDERRLHDAAAPRSLPSRKQRGPPEGPSNASSPRSRGYSSDSSRVGNGEGSTEPNPPRNPGIVGNDGAAGSGVPVVPVRLAPERARAALPVDPAAPVRLAAVGVARAPVR